MTSGIWTWRGSLSRWRGCCGGRGVPGGPFRRFTWGGGGWAPPPPPSRGPYADGFRQDLAAKGYHPQVIGRQARLMADLSAWLEVQGRCADALTAGILENFVRARRASGARVLASARAVAPLLGYLRAVGAAPAPQARAPRTAAEALLAEFAGYLARERGLSPASVGTYLPHARPFLAWLDRPLDEALAGLQAAQVPRFMTSRCGQWGSGPAQATVTALRSLLRSRHAP